MRRVNADGQVEFRPSITAASLPLAASAVIVTLATAVLVAVDVAPPWTLGTALAGAFLVFCTSFVMPFLRTLVVEPGRISGPSGYGVNTLLLDRLDLAACGIDRFGGTRLVDDLGSVLVLEEAGITPAEIDEVLRIFGLDPALLRHARCEA